ncbi:fungal trichothecene efflux pump [Halenospora varia]|nr:fungal trichothecene efflux pump [Halenospora varia]
MSTEKDLTITHAEDSQQSIFSDKPGVIETTDDAIVRQIETTGEEVGFTWRTGLAVFTVILCYNAYLFCLQIPPAMLTMINADLGPDARYTWITISWNLGGAIVVTIAGRLSDLFGRRYFFLAGSIILLIGSIVAATGKSINQMIAGGVVFGVGSGILEMSYGAIQEIVPTEWRTVAVGLLDMSQIIGGSTPLVAWALYKRTHTWRSAYYYMLAYEVVTVIFVFFFYHPPSFETKHRNDGKSKMDILKKLDYIGLALFVAGCCLFIVGLSWGGSVHPWKSAPTIAPIVVGFALLVTLGFYEAYANIEYPILPPRLFKRVRQFTMPLIVIAISGMQYYSNAVLWPRMSQLLWASDEISKGLYGECIPLGSMIGGVMIMISQRIGHQRWQIVFWVCVQTACVGTLSTSTPETPIRSIILIVIVAISVAPAQLVTIVMLCFGLENQNDIGVASGLAGTTRLLFGAVATAIFSNITNNKYASSLPSQVSRAVTPLGFPSSSLSKLAVAAKLNTAKAYSSVPGVTPAIKAAATHANKLAYLEGTHLSFLVAMAFGFVACVAAYFTVSIDKRKFTKKTMAVVEKDRGRLEERKREGQA